MKFIIIGFITLMGYFFLSMDSKEKNSSLYLKSKEKDCFSVNDSTSELFEFSLWPNKKPGMMLIRINDSLGLKLGFAPHGMLISKTECKIINSNFIEDGICYKFDDRGILTKSITYKDGVINGKYTTYDENGKIVKTTHMYAPMR